MKCNLIFIPKCGIIHILYNFIDSIYYFYINPCAFDKCMYYNLLTLYTLLCYKYYLTYILLSDFPLELLGFLCWKIIFCLHKHMIQSMHKMFDSIICYALNFSCLFHKSNQKRFYLPVHENMLCAYRRN